MAEWVASYAISPYSMGFFTGDLCGAYDQVVKLDRYVATTPDSTRFNHTMCGMMNDRVVEFVKAMIITPDSTRVHHTMRVGKKDRLAK